MLPTEDLFVYVYVLVDDAVSSGAIAIAARPGPAPCRVPEGGLARELRRYIRDQR